MRGMVQQLKKPKISLVPPAGSVQAGYTHDNKPLWKLKRLMNRPVPNIEAEVSEKCGTDARGNPEHTWKDDRIDHPVCAVCGTIGKRLYKTHSQTGEKIVAIRKSHLVEEERLFTLEDCGNCNDAIIDYIPPTPAELEAERRKERIKAMDGTLAQILVDGGVTPEKLLASLKAPATPVQVDPTLQGTTTGSDVPFTNTTVEVQAPPEPEVTYPVYMPVGRYQLSNGEIVKAKKEDAIEMESVLQAERDEAKADAEVAAKASF